MIRFSCAHCGRAYLLADAMAHLPLVCKGCGQRLNVPDPEPEPPPPPPVAAPKPKPKPPEPKKPVAPPAEDVPPAPEAEDEPQPAAAAVPKTNPPVRKPPAPAPAAAKARGGRLVPVVVDVALALGLMAGGAIGAETFLKKSSREVIVAASTAPKFPPIDLLIWAGAVVLPGLIYAWLGMRGWTVGGWLRRRAAR